MTAKILTTTFGPDFILRTLKTTGVVLLVALLFGTMYFGFYDGLAVFSAGIWSMVNLIFLSAFIRAAVRPDGVDKLTVFGLAFIKFPLLYAAGYFLMTADIFRPLPLLVGFSIIIVVMALKAVARALLNLDIAGAGKTQGAA
jgi:hypothetical protein